MLIGDIPGMSDTGLPPTPDPGPNTDTCVGASEADASFLCEINVAVESIEPAV